VKKPINNLKSKAESKSGLPFYEIAVGFSAGGNSSVLTLQERIDYSSVMELYVTPGERLSGAFFNYGRHRHS
jgi:hypothetical protein